MTASAEKKFDSREACNVFASHLSSYVKTLPDKRKFEFTEANMQVIKLLVHYFAKQDDFSTLGEDFSLSKGIFLYGPAGTGKSTIMEAFKQWTCRSNPFRIVDCREIQWAYTQKGYDAITMYGKNSYLYKYETGHSRSNGSITYCFDDFGAEDSSKHFGNETQVMSEILQDRYNERQLTGMITHMTSNLGKNGLTIEKLYGTRIRSRMREMFNFIELNDVDHRR